VTCVRGRNDPRIAAVASGEGAVGKAFSEARIVREDGLIAVPLMGASQPCGCLVVISPLREASDSLLNALASQVAAGIQLAQLKDQMVRRNKDLLTALTGLKCLEKNREGLLSSVSHDLKNPLTTIKVYLNLLGQQNLGDLTERQAKAVEVCERNADRLLRMITDLVMHSRLQSGKMQLNERPFGLKALVEEVMQGLSSTASRAEVQMTLLPSPEIFVRGDRERLSEAIYNLVDNAVQHTRQTVEVALSSDGSGPAAISISDDGKGIAEDDLEHIFDSYYRGQGLGTKGGVHGLGLPIAAKIVQLHGGRIKVRSVEGQGSTFETYLPAFAAAVRAPTDGPTPRAGEILLVEDDQDCREVLQQVLEETGHSVIAAATTSEAIATLRALRPAMVLLDLRLSSEDGRSVLHHIRKTPPLSKVPVYMISGATEISSLTSGQGIDRIDGFFEKPLNLSKLLGTVATVVHPARAPESVRKI
jgi:signal transduction histidine kinase/CheY-like chemotaxis protein